MHHNTVALQFSENYAKLIALRFFFFLIATSFQTSHCILCYRHETESDNNNSSFLFHILRAYTAVWLNVLIKKPLNLVSKKSLWNHIFQKLQSAYFKFNLTKKIFSDYNFQGISWTKLYLLAKLPTLAQINLSDFNIKCLKLFFHSSLCLHIAYMTFKICFIQCKRI